MMTAFEKPCILDTIQNEGIEMKHRGRYFWACCPLHTEKTPSFAIDPERQTFYCFGCQAHGDVISFIEQHKKLSFKDAVKYLGISNGKPSFETLKRIKQAKEKAEIVRKFREWGVDYHSELCALYRTLQNAKAKVLTTQDAYALQEWYHKEPLWVYQIDILEGRDDEEKFNLYKEVTNGNESRF